MKHFYFWIVASFDILLILLGRSDCAIVLTLMAIFQMQLAKIDE
ncbi:hypothetical protein [Paenibacillus tianjinensis]|nr:hypothetical protein [Paenibacillus tianjinensis]